MNWLKYFTLGSTVFSTVFELIPLVQSPAKLDGKELFDEAWPAVQAVSGVFPKAKVPEDLALEICIGIATIVNKYYKKGA